MILYVRSLIRSLIRDEKAQDAFEYLLVIGGISVAVIVAMTTPVGTTLIRAVINGVCSAIDSIGGADAGIELTCPLTFT